MTAAVFKQYTRDSNQGFYLQFSERIHRRQGRGQISFSFLFYNKCTFNTQLNLKIIGILHQTTVFRVYM